MTEHHFHTPDTVALYVEARAGTVDVTMTETTESHVRVTGRDADDVSVELDGHELSVVVPRARAGFFGGDDSLAIAVTVPTRSDLAVQSGSADVAAVGEIGSCQVKTGSGEVRLDVLTGAAKVSTGSGDVEIDESHAGLRIKCGSGDVSVGRARDAVAVSTGSGDVEIGSQHGAAVVKTGSGDVHVVDTTADLTVSTGSGDMSVDTAHRGRLSAKGASGSVRVGIPDGTPVWTDISTVSGHIHNTIEGAGQPAEGEDHVELRATTVSGDVFLSQR